MPIDILHGDPGNLVDTDGLDGLLSSIQKIAVWVPSMADIIQDICSSRVAEYLDRKATLPELRALHFHLRQVKFILLRSGIKNEAVCPLEGLAAVIHARIWALTGTRDEPHIAAEAMAGRWHAAGLIISEREYK